MNPREWLRQYLDKILEMKGQDLILKVGTNPRTRIGTNVQQLSFPEIKAEETAAIAEQLLNPTQKTSLEKQKSVDFSFSVHENGQRFRANIFSQQGHYSVVVRTLWRDIPSFEDLKIPPVLKQVALSKCGIILVGGVVASGKTTTINAMIEMMNQNVHRHVITLEDPIEYLHKDKQCVINQREIGQDANDFESALKYVVRQSPDVVVIGEMRDRETFQFAVSAAEVGRLVIGTVHARSVVQIFDRVLGFFPAEQHDVVLGHLYPNINCFMVQQLLLGKDNVSYVPACEIMIGNYTTRQLVKEKKYDKLAQAMRNAAQEGMMTMDQSLHQLWQSGLISKETALAATERPQELENTMKGISLEGQAGKILGS